MKKHITAEDGKYADCPCCLGGALSFDYYDHSITCLNCGAVWTKLKSQQEEAEAAVKQCTEDVNEFLNVVLK